MLLILRQFTNPKFYLLVAIDVCMCLLGWWLAYHVRFDFHMQPFYVEQQWAWAPAVVGWKILCLFVGGAYRGLYRYSSLTDLFRIFWGLLSATVGLALYIGLVHRFEGFSRGIVIFDGLLTLFLVCGVRVLIRVSLLQGHLGRDFWNRMPGLGGGQPVRRRVLMIGAGAHGDKILREIQGNPNLPFRVVAVLDDDSGKVGRQLQGVPIVGGVEKLEDAIRDYRIDEVVIAIVNASAVDMRRVVEHCEQFRLPFRILPGMGELIGGQVTVNSLRQVNFADLLGRKPVDLESGTMDELVRGKTVLVTGAGGSIGSELCVQLANYQPGCLVLVDACEENLFHIQNRLQRVAPGVELVPVLTRIQHRPVMDAVFARYQPGLVLHAAAYKHVPMMELNPWEAVYNNMIGSRVMMEVAAAHGVPRFVLVSSDKAVRPTNVMGCSKRIAERIMQSMPECDTVFMAVRFGNVVGSSGSVLPLFREQIGRGGPLTVTDPKVTRYFMTIPEAARLILQAASMGEGRDIFILDMGTPVCIADMARDLIKLSGKEPDVDIKIEFTGLRPGEKLYEELITEGEGIRPTSHDKIRRLLPEDDIDAAALDHSDLKQGLVELCEAADAHDEIRIREVLQRLVPEYSPQNHPSVI